MLKHNSVMCGADTSQGCYETFVTLYHQIEVLVKTRQGQLEAEFADDPDTDAKVAEHMFQEIGHVIATAASGL